MIVIGAGAAGLMCAAQAGQRGRNVWLIDHSKQIAEKIRISGGGRCNFTNLNIRPDCYVSQNPHFAKSALKQYTQQDFIKLVNSYGIAWHEKKLGQLFCDQSAQQIIDMLMAECDKGRVHLETGVQVQHIQQQAAGEYLVKTNKGTARAHSVVIATGGLSIPKIGATKFAYDVAEQFGIKIIPPRAGLVPLTFQNELLEQCKELSGVSVDATVTIGKTSFAEGLLFAHRGFSGPSILQISSYWRNGAPIHINLAPQTDVASYLQTKKKDAPKILLHTALSELLPKRLAVQISGTNDGRLADLSDKLLKRIGQKVNDWQVIPSGTEGYRTAEVTLGGIDTNELSSQTMEVKKHPGIYFIGEAVDVTGWLGGYNFQWAWSSGFVAGQYA